MVNLIKNNKKKGFRLIPEALKTLQEALEPPVKQFVYFRETIECCDGNISRLSYICNFALCESFL